ncbi:DUF4185 domain-containing protein [Mycolicibacter hiberniae]|uniref:Uncharacterized protein n=1 Tax=Mycolicibacter hiberniae TaxID=29314 RepID=A0A7I7X709_9MYCO|nr:DUF4185 domain-containing protein [Mycolicibacter hiberniae]MCV7087475.1 DUF4185 domain-containing protein [Mycolicibacter hiberniae]ORV69048.1 hypothetical protein AWC09_13800 [Mycolicibacter hiberniae]BBZ25005.1 hypothetical protein MHIB_34230 [Mycolicibacter hiberniae]
MRPAARNAPGKLADVTGPGITDRWGATCADLGASVLAPNGTLVSVFGDTFAGDRVGQGDWRSPVILIGTGDATHRIRYHRAGGIEAHYARQLWHYRHREPVSWRDRDAISTVIPSDLLRVEQMLYLHAIVNRGFGHVAWTEIWQSADNGVSWHNVGTRFAARLHRGHAQCWSWDYDPEDGWVYVVSTGFQRDKGVILQRVRPAHLGDPRKYSGWGYRGERRAWGRPPVPVTPPGETWGELSLRRLAPRTWVLGGFISSHYALGYRVLESPAADLAGARLQLPLLGCGWEDEDHARGIAQLYGGYVLPRSRVDHPGGVGLMVSQWHTARGWPYRAMQFRATLVSDRDVP